MSTRPHVSLGVKALDLHLSSFAKTCQDNKTKYVEATMSGKPLGSHHHLQRVFVPAGEREEASDVTKKTNSQLCGLIEDTIGRLHDAGADDLAGSLRREYMKDVRTGTKAVLPTFLQRAGDTSTAVLEQEESHERADDAPGH
ncbi:uncharacterized protein LOC124270378 [Haliotis rubra]|uniref:uncharacterized protein LOC124270378 n=1 Tax=Haliotis rubra TaxID=36100 RepID=UPI001EE52973|nr:uncharacterized protein LOC124270378 [Haliotis rubra]